ncbi:MAG: DNA alkylation repair protein [Pyrinomonadaceae bacterium]
MHEYIKPLAEKFKESAVPENAPQMKAYMKDRFEFFGIKTPARKAISREFFSAHGIPDHFDLEEIVFNLFELPQREFHYFAIDLCGKLRKEWKIGSMKLFEKMALTRSWWDSVDSINIVCIKPYFAKFPDQSAAVTQRWIDSQNIWLQRLSLIFQLRLTNKTDLKILERNILQLNGSEEFFIQKAIGWALRDYAKTDPNWVLKFVRSHDLKPLSRREALKHIAPNPKT